MTNVYLLSTDAVAASGLASFLTYTNAVAVHGCAFLIPWQEGFASLVARVGSLLARDHTRVVIVEVNGDYQLIGAASTGPEDFSRARWQRALDGV